MFLVNEIFRNNNCWFCTAFSSLSYFFNFLHVLRFHCQGIRIYSIRFLKVYQVFIHTHSLDFSLFVIDYMGFRFIAIVALIIKYTRTYYLSFGVLVEIIDLRDNIVFIVRVGLAHSDFLTSIVYLKWFVLCCCTDTNLLPLWHTVLFKIYFLKVYIYILKFLQYSQCYIYLSIAVVRHCLNILLSVR